MLTNSYEIRRQSYRLIHFSRYPYNWPAYAESMGTIINLLIYFDSAEGGAFTIDKDDFDSPYYFDDQGEIQKKNQTVITMDDVNDSYDPISEIDPSKITEILSMDAINAAFKRSLM